MGIAALESGEACHPHDAKSVPLKYISGSGLQARIRLGCAARGQADDDGFVRFVVKDGVVEISFAFFPLTSINE
jgi:hypothetical protein